MADELSAALRELAAAQESAPVVGGPATRALAMRRRRRRRAAAALGAGTATLVLLGFAWNLYPGGAPDRPAGSRPPAAAPPRSTPSSTATPTPVSGVLDLSGQTLTFGGRAMRVHLESGALLGATSPMTVVAKEDPRELPLQVSPESPPIGPTEVSVRYVVELRDGRGRRHSLGLSSPQLRALSGADAEVGWIALGAEDAEWFYARVRPGDTLSVTTGTTPEAAPSATGPSAAAPSATAPSAAAPSVTGPSAAGG